MPLSENQSPRDWGSELPSSHLRHGYEGLKESEFRNLTLSDATTVMIVLAPTRALVPGSDDVFLLLYECEAILFFSNL